VRVIARLSLGPEIIQRIIIRERVTCADCYAEEIALPLIIRGLTQSTVTFERTVRCRALCEKPEKLASNISASTTIRGCTIETIGDDM